MADKRIVEEEIKLKDWIILLCFFVFVLWFVCGCASQAKQIPQMDSVHYVAQVQQQNYGPRNYGPTSIYQSDVSYQRFGVGGYSFKETSTGFSELSWYFRDSKVKSFRVIPHWTTRRYGY